MTDDKDNTTAELQEQFDDDIHIEHLKYVEQRCMEFGMWGPPMMMVHSALKLAQDELESGARETIDKLTAENRALKREIKQVQGNMRTQLNNVEGMKLKYERLNAELAERKRKMDERDRMTADEVAGQVLGELAERAERLREQRDDLSVECGKLNDLLTDIRLIAERRKAYTLVDEKGEAV